MTLDELPILQTNKQLRTVQDIMEFQVNMLVTYHYVEAVRKSYGSASLEDVNHIASKYNLTNAELYNNLVRLNEYTLKRDYKDK